jgi:hypothetical protein
VRRIQHRRPFNPSMGESQTASRGEKLLKKFKTTALFCRLDATFKRVSRFTIQQVQAKGGADAATRRTRLNDAGAWSRIKQGDGMSLADKFDDHIEPAFTRSFDRESARRQFRMSLMLVAAMGLAAFILGFAQPLTTPSPAKQNAQTIESGFSGRLVTIDAN